MAMIVQRYPINLVIIVLSLDIIMFYVIICKEEYLFHYLAVMPGGDTEA